MAIFNGFQVGDIEVLSIEEIKQKNIKLDENIEMASSLTVIEYPDAVSSLEETYGRYKTIRRKYEELIETSNLNDESAYETKEYDIVYIWELFGKYATARNISIGLEVKKARTVGKTSLYDLNFRISGEYVNISQFISDIENNSDLYFRIYDFKMSGSGQVVSASFTVKNINLNSETLM